MGPATRAKAARRPRARSRTSTGPRSDAAVMSVAEGPLAGATVAVLGGTGPQGRGLVRRWAAPGVPVVVASRSAERAAETAADVPEATGGDVRGLANAEAASAADVV